MSCLVFGVYIVKLIAWAVLEPIVPGTPRLGLLMSIIFVP